MSLVVNVIRNSGGQVQLTTSVLPVADADTFKLYWSLTSGGPYSFIQEFPNTADATVAAASCLTVLYRAAISVATSTPFYVKITKVKSLVESLLVDSNETSVPMEGTESWDNIQDEATVSSQIHGFVPAQGRWTRLTSTPSGQLNTSTVVTASALPVGAATEAKQDDQIALLTTIDQSTDATETAVESIDSKLNTLGQKPMSGSVPVTIASDQSRLDVVEILTTSSVSALITVTSAAAVPLPATPMANRKKIIIQNRGATDLLLGVGGIQIIRLGTNGVFEQPFGPGILVEGIRTAGSGDVAVWEAA